MFWYEYSVTLLRPPSPLLVIKQATAQDQWFYFWYMACKSLRPTIIPGLVTFKQYSKVLSYVKDANEKL